MVNHGDAKPMDFTLRTANFTFPVEAEIGNMSIISGRVATNLMREAEKTGRVKARSGGSKVTVGIPDLRPPPSPQCHSVMPVIQLFFLKTPT